MRPTVKAILGELRQGLEGFYGDRLVRMVLYGSEARGDAQPGSDIDVLIVLRGDVCPCEEIARTSEVVAELSLRHDVVIVPAFVSEDQYEREQSPLLLNVRREGVPR
jgi:predicted nucleotidyltransferase